MTELNAEIKSRIVCLALSPIITVAICRACGSSAAPGKTVFMVCVIFLLSSVCTISLSYIAGIHGKLSEYHVGVTWLFSLVFFLIGYMGVSLYLIEAVINLISVTL